ncbi:hypothetical protein D8Y24_09110 [Agrococcus lahaulensis]|nr:hypothetical protein D8Y24_09110 [Agrococcus lahaulensis]
MSNVNLVNEMVGDPSVFARDVYAREPFLRRGAVSNPEEFVSLQSIAALLKRGSVRRSDFFLARNGVRLQSDDFLRVMRVRGNSVADIADASLVLREVNKGATLVMSALDRHVDHVARAVEDLRALLRFHTEAMVFVTPPANQAFPVHHDGTDTLILQTVGTKHWSVWSPPEDVAQTSEGYDESTLPEPMIDVVLEPGDVLHVPRRYPHRVRSVDNTSVHVTFASRPDDWAMVLLLGLEAALARSRHAGDYVDRVPTSEEFAAELRSRVDEVLAGVQSGSDEFAADLARSLTNRSLNGGRGLGGLLD